VSGYVRVLIIEVWIIEEALYYLQFTHVHIYVCASDLTERMCVELVY